MADQTGKASTNGRKQELDIRFRGSLDAFAQHYQSRLDGVRRQLSDSAARSTARRERYETAWRPKLDVIDAVLQEFGRCKEVRPSLCLMGKRGQGKTSLLRGWLGQTQRQNGLQEVSLLPIGVSDTTACLTRLSVGKDLDEGCLYVELLPQDAFEGIEKPPSPQLPNAFRLARRIDIPEMDDSAAFCICRFPYDGVGIHDDRAASLRLSRQDNEYRISTTGEACFAHAQWYAKHVRIPVKIDEHANGYPEQLLRAIDVVDAPGADAMKTGSCPEWRQRKNAYVFQVAANQLDILLLVSSLNPDGAQLGNQFQEDIWRPWLKRCDGAGSGRLIVVFSHTVSAFKQAENRLIRLGKGTAASAMQQNVDDNFARLVIKNVLDALMTPLNGMESFIRQGDPSTWPPIFFTENLEGELQKYTEGVDPGQGQEVAKHLCAELDRNKPNGSLGLGQQCILRMVKDWGEISLLAPERIRPVQEWLIGALCALLDPRDRGYARLTEFVIGYATCGPVAENHCRERRERAQDIRHRFNGLLADFAQPAGDAAAMAELREAQLALKEVWARYPTGPELVLGDSSHRRRGDAETNGNALTVIPIEFNFHDVLHDVTSDVVARLADLPIPWTEMQLEIVDRVLWSLMIKDEPLVRLGTKYRESFTKRVELLARIQTVAVERAIRIMHYLALANEEDLKQVARYCYETDVEEVELLRPLLTTGLTEVQKEDEEALQGVRSTADSLLEFIRERPFPNPYSHENSLSVEETP